MLCAFSPSRVTIDVASDQWSDWPWSASGDRRKTLLSQSSQRCKIVLSRFRFSVISARRGPLSVTECPVVVLNGIRRSGQGAEKINPEFVANIPCSDNQDGSDSQYSPFRVGGC
ncbi:hypothetical protein JMJ77_0012120 [Colletotrichum scovillei]|uniref:Uncharacterized protein n=1 Tax=Colletotrichum scovillei TaxID=1209932 RepID=A0A9P7QRD2_9PEZI|nr:hypothetical protein JMJ78_0001172 [Colletotrichum scovillei]KAG7041600.1 hypothetical protein JMJ77_0012120 [Colletotrichum scovillei]KAG7061626.1 hypothetical protein JMJ76_0003587 [Colletotrichum scovillei]